MARGRRNGVIAVFSVVIIRVRNPFSIAVIAQVRETEGQVVQRFSAGKAGVPEAVFTFWDRRGDLNGDVDGASLR